MQSSLEKILETPENDMVCEAEEENPELVPLPKSRKSSFADQVEAVETQMKKFKKSMQKFFNKHIGKFW